MARLGAGEAVRRGRRPAGGAGSCQSRRRPYAGPARQPSSARHRLSCSPPSPAAPRGRPARIRRASSRAPPSGRCRRWCCRRGRTTGRAASAAHVAAPRRRGTAWRNTPVDTAPMISERPEASSEVWRNHSTCCGRPSGSTRRSTRCRPRPAPSAPPSPRGAGPGSSTGTPPAAASARTSSRRAREPLRRALRGHQGDPHARRAPRPTDSDRVALVAVEHRVARQRGDRRTRPWWPSTRGSTTGPTTGPGARAAGARSPPAGRAWRRPGGTRRRSRAHAVGGSWARGDPARSRATPAAPRSWTVSVRRRSRSGRAARRRDVAAS